MNMKYGDDSQKPTEPLAASQEQQSSGSLWKSTRSADPKSMVPLGPRVGDLKDIKNQLTEELTDIIETESDKKLTSDGKIALAQFLDNASRGYAATLGMICQGPNCPFLSGCKLNDLGSKLPIGKKCQPPGTLVLTSNRGEVPIELLDQNSDLLITFGYSKGNNTNLEGFRTRGRKFTLHTSIYNDELIRLTTESNKSHEVTKAHINLVRWNDKAKGKFVVYLMKKGDYFRVGKSTLIKISTKGKSYSGMSQRGNTERADAMWILGVYNSNELALLGEEYFSVKYSIPKACFIATKKETRKKYKNALYEWVSQKDLDAHHSLLKKPIEYWAQMLKELGLDINYPFWEHRMSRASSVKSQNMGGITYTMEVRGCNLLPEIMNVCSISKINISSRKDEGTWEPIKNIERKSYNGIVYSLDVEKEQTYIANKICTHNCPIEASIVTLWINKHLRALGIEDPDDPINSFDMDMLYELAGQELIRWRCGVHLSKTPSLLTTQTVGFSNQGEPIFAEVMNPVLEIMEKSGRNISKIREALVATREAQLKAGNVKADPSTRQADLRKKALEIIGNRRQPEAMKEADFKVKE